jgi:hypothetical protein
MSDFIYTDAARRVTQHERNSATRERDYSALVEHFELGADTDSATITDAARTIVIDGEAALGRTVTANDLKGRTPTPTMRLSWKAARAVRIGLVSAIERNNPDDGASTSTPDYLALAVQAATTAHNKAEVPTEVIVAAIVAALGE